MHPAYSVILFTTLSGAGYGLLFLLSVLGVSGGLPADRWLGFAGFAIAFTLITAGLLSSMLHLGHPERAWRAISQWRSSWLSREGVMSLITYVPAGLFAIGWVFVEATGDVWAVFGVGAALAAVVTVYCTAMIYASLSAIRQWHNEWVVPVYLVLALAGGALWLYVLALAFGVDRAGFGWMAVAALVAGLALKVGYWLSVDRARRGLTPGDATGLGRYGTVRQWEGPHTQANYLMREMGYQVARRHARILRWFAAIVGFVVPALLILGAMAVGGPGAAVIAMLGVLLNFVGLLAERWLFFAEAQHAVTLYYGAQSA